MVRTYFICCTSRSGSSYLCELLASAGLGLPEEYFNPDPGSGEPYWREKLGLSQDDPLERYADKLLQNRTTNGCFGAKGIRSAYRRMSSAMDIDKRILLRRRDTLRQAISLYRAKTTGRYGYRDGQEPPPQCKFDEQEIRRCELQIINSNHGWRVMLGPDRLDLFYEDVVQHPMREVLRVGRFLRRPVRSNDLTVSTKVMRDEMTEEWVQRLEDKCTGLQD